MRIAKRSPRPSKNLGPMKHKLKESEESLKVVATNQDVL